MQVIAQGDSHVAPSVLRRLIADFTRKEPKPRPEPIALEELTPRERDVLTLIAKGLSNAEISETLVVAPQTTKTHVGRIFRKLNVRDRAQAVIAATNPASFARRTDSRERRCRSLTARRS